MLRSRRIKILMFVLCLAPLGWLGWKAWNDDLSANPIEYITHLTGDWTIRFIVLTLAITPLRKLLRLPELVRFRRMLGLFAFFYGSLHFLTWLGLDKLFDIKEIAQDLTKRPFIIAGALGLLSMLPLAITSTKGWIRRLGIERWRLLHRLVYGAAIAGVVHYYWLVKSDIRWPAFYGALVAILLASRLVGWKSRAGKTLALRLSDIRRQTHDTVTLRFPLRRKDKLDWRPGQFLTFDWIVDGKKLPRSYSISSSPLQRDYFEITVKQQGIVSSFLNRSAKEGLKVRARGPFGQFCFDEERHSSIVLFAGGSGITPIMSILQYIEERSAKPDITLFYAVRTEHDVIFGEDLERLKERLSRFRCFIIASRPGSGWLGPSGHLSREIIEPRLGPIDHQMFFLCGPAAFMTGMKEILMALGAAPNQIRQELFTVGTGMAANAKAARFSVEFARSGGNYECSSADYLLTVAEKHGIDIECGCRIGQCGTCATRVLDGEVEMQVEEGLDPALKERGYRLLCVGQPRSRVCLDA